MARPKSKKQMGVWGTIGVLVLMAALYALDSWQKSNKSSPRGSSDTGTSTRPPRDATTPGRDGVDNAAIVRMWEQRAHEKWVEGASIVVKVLPDDTQGSRHQRFLIRISRDVRVKVAHNIDLAPRAPVKAGDLVSYRGKFIHNDLGGVLHWTHHDPRGRRKGGWLRHKDKVYK